MQIKIERSGVVQVDYEGIWVNEEEIVHLLEAEIEKMNPRPKCDCNAKFAAKVTITVEFLGDMEEQDNG